MESSTPTEQVSTEMEPATKNKAVIANLSEITITADQKDVNDIRMSITTKGHVGMVELLNAVVTLSKIIVSNENAPTLEGLLEIIERGTKDSVTLNKPQ